MDGVRPSGPGKGEQADVLEEKGQGGQTCRSDLRSGCVPSSHKERRGLGKAGEMGDGASGNVLDKPVVMVSETVL